MFGLKECTSKLRLLAVQEYVNTLTICLHFLSLLQENGFVPECSRSEQRFPRFEDGLFCLSFGMCGFVPHLSSLDVPSGTALLSLETMVRSSGGRHQTQAWQSCWQNYNYIDLWHSLRIWKVPSVPSPLSYSLVRVLDHLVS